MTINKERTQLNHKQRLISGIVEDLETTIRDPITHGVSLTVIELYA